MKFLVKATLCDKSSTVMHGSVIAQDPNVYITALLKLLYDAVMIALHVRCSILNGGLIIQF